MKAEIVCNTCGTQMPDGFDTSKDCPVCLDDRQYLPVGGQKWTTQKEIHQNHSVRVIKLKENLYEFTTLPKFAIGQRAIFLIMNEGNVLWDCIPLLAEPLRSFIESKGGLNAIAFSHPHYYSNMNTWASTFNCPVYIHHLDEPWIFDKGPDVELWKGDEMQLLGGMRLINLGGHFPGSAILHASSFSDSGIICSGDTFYVSPSLKHVSVMYSYPNLIPLPLSEITRIRNKVEKLKFDELYGFWSYQNIVKNPKHLILESLDRYK